MEAERATVTKNSIGLIREMGEFEENRIKEQFADKERKKREKEEKKLVEKRWKMEKGLALDIAKLNIDKYKTGYEAKLFYLALEYQAEKANADKLGINLDNMLKAKYKYLRDIAAQSGGTSAWGTAFGGTPMSTRAPGYGDPSKAIQQQMLLAQKTRNGQLTAEQKAADFAEKIYIRMEEFSPIGTFNPP